MKSLFFVFCLSIALVDTAPAMELITPITTYHGNKDHSLIPKNNVLTNQKSLASVGEASIRRPRSNGQLGH